MSLGRFLGNEPVEHHEHRDAEGNLTGTTTVRREPEWDDEQRQIVIDKIAYDRQIHRGCGNHVADAMNPTVSRSVEHYRATCEDCRAIEATRKRWHDSQGHPKDGPCPCDDEVFFVEHRDPLPQPILDQLLRNQPDAVQWL